MEGLPSSANLNAGVEANGQPARRKRQRKTHATKSMAEPMTWLTPWTTTLGMTQYESKEQRLHDEIVAYVSYITPTTQEHHARKEVVARVEDVVKRRFSDATVTTFGSMAHDLYFPDGDIDLVICVPREVEHSNKKKMLFQLSAALKDSLMTQKVHVIHQARVPILSFETIPDLGSLKMDMSINASDGVQAIPIIVDYLHKMPALRHLVYVVKGFLLREQLNSASNGGMSSYALICLVISFLQVNPKNRPAEFIQKPLESESLGILLMDFFDYYAETFPYDTSYISVREGKILPKEDKGWENEAQRDRLSIECLVNPDHDVGRSTGKIARIRSAFRDAHSKLQNLPFTIDCANALGTILGVTEQTLQYRDHLKELVDFGTLRVALAMVRLPQGRSNLPSHSSLPRKPHTSEGGYGTSSYHSGYSQHHNGFPDYGGRQYYDSYSSHNSGYGHYGGYRSDLPYGPSPATGSSVSGRSSGSHTSERNRPPKRSRR